MKAIKRTLCVLVMLGIMSSFCVCQQEIDSFYVKSRKADGFILKTEVGGWR